MQTALDELENNRTPGRTNRATLNAALDLDKNEGQIAPSVEDDTEPEGDAPKGSSIPPRIQPKSAPVMT
jgi:hypothetical protein